ncbi:hypothetical protein NDA16_002472 [Ustilago loliicola]|nr:hypothetical protein NDA16_002472 [Ustilago loliicola]
MTKGNYALEHEMQVSFKRKHDEAINDQAEATNKLRVIVESGPESFKKLAGLIKEQANTIKEQREVIKQQGDTIKKQESVIEKLEESSNEVKEFIRRNKEACSTGLTLFAQISPEAEKDESSAIEELRTSLTEVKSNFQKLRDEHYNLTVSWEEEHAQLEDTVVEVKGSMQQMKKV